MRHLSVLAALAALCAAPPARGDDPLPAPPPKPLGVLVRDSGSIHVLQVAPVRVTALKGGAATVPRGDFSFKRVRTLKGKPADAPFAEDTPFLYLGPYGSRPRADQFPLGATVLCFAGRGAAALFAGGRWALGVPPSGLRRHWYYMAEDRYGPTYDGSTRELIRHVSAILAGRETTVTARAPHLWDAVGRPRLWRIQASLKVTDFVLSEESPHFAGWGSGDPHEAASLARTLLGGAAPEPRIAAADDLAHLRPPAPLALATLRRTLRDPVRPVAVASAAALARLDPRDKDAPGVLESCLAHRDAEVRCAACDALADLGPRARSALPGLLAALADKDPQVRCSAARAVGRLGPHAPSPDKVVTALAGLLKVEKEGIVLSYAVGALRCLGPDAWPAVAPLRERLAALAEAGVLPSPAVEAVSLLARFDPPPVELLGALVEDRRSCGETRWAAARRLASLGPRARLALPALRRALMAPRQPADWGARSLSFNVADALLAIDPDEGPPLVTPALLALLKDSSQYRARVLGLLGACGSAAKPSVPMLVAAIDPEDYFANYTVGSLAPLLGPENRRLLPLLGRLSGNRGRSVALAKVLLRLGYRPEALIHAARCLKSEDPGRRAAAARWLGERGREARTVEPALRQALADATGAERSRLALTLWRVRGAPGTAPHVRALSGLSDLLALAEGERPAVGPIFQQAFWRFHEPWTETQENAAVAAAVAAVLGRLDAGGDPVATLARLLKEKDPHVRLAAAVALSRASPRHPDLVPAFRRLLERHPWFFCYAADSLAALGPLAAPLAPLLLPLLRHPDESLYRAADRVLRRINPALAAKGWGAAGASGAAPADLQPLWKDLAGADAFRADLAVWRLAGAGPRAVALLRKRLRPPRALAPKRIGRLIRDLDGDDFAARERAAAELARVAEAAAPLLRKARSSNASLELRLRLDRLLSGIDPPRDPEHLRRLRALRLLEEEGGPEARELLRRLGEGDPGIGLPWDEAANALRRLDRR
jgi:hypothetical protein